MTIPSLLIVTDRGGLRAFKVEPNPNRAPSLHLLDTFEASETHGRYQDKVSDQAGRFQGGSHNTGNGVIGGADEHGTIDIENRRRACKHIAGRINQLVKSEKPGTWLLAVPAEIHKLVLDHVDDEALKRLSEPVHANLLKSEPSKIASHFTELRPA